jgi:hypothetical protein
MEQTFVRFPIRKIIQYELCDLKESSTNGKNDRGRKLCPISYVVLKPENSIKINKTFYSTSGLFSYLSSTGYFNNKTHGFDEHYFILTHLKDPMTNVCFEHEDAVRICQLLLRRVSTFYY